MSIGIIGKGAFGTFLESSLDQFDDVVTWDKGDDPDDLEDVCNVELLILAVPVQDLDEVCAEVWEHVADEVTCVMDVCSTKVESEQIMARHFENYICSHPLTGPPSADEITEDDVLVVTRAEGETALDMVEFFKGAIGMKIVKMSAEDHDERMSYMQAIPFFIARTLRKVGILEAEADDPLITPSFRKLLEVAKIDAAHSDEVYDSITGTLLGVQAIDDLWDSIEEVYCDLPDHT